MKQPAFVFGVSMLAACAPHPKQPLYGGDGSPACGNIGQVGRPQTTTIAATAALVPPLADRSWVVPPRTSRASPLLAPGRKSQALTVARPLVTREDRVASGNVMSKGGSRRTEVEEPVDARATPAPEMATLEHRAQRPLLTREHRAAVGNMNRKSDDDDDDATTREATRVLVVTTLDDDVQRPLLTREQRPAAGNVKNKKKADMATPRTEPMAVQLANGSEQRSAHDAKRKVKSSAERRARRLRAASDDVYWKLPAGAEDDLAAYEAELAGKR